MRWHLAVLPFAVMPFVLSPLPLARVSHRTGITGHKAFDTNPNRQRGQSVGRPSLALRCGRGQISWHL
jgi:hypothetical protein